jgi:hypothetical protein
MKMKMKQADFKRLEKSMNMGLCCQPDRYRDYINMGYSEERWRWDVFFRFVHPVFQLDLYRYLTDSNIDTALRKITSTE